MPPKRNTQGPLAPSSPHDDEKVDEAPATPSPIKRKLQELEGARKLKKRSSTKAHGVKLTKYIADDDVVAFCVEGARNTTHELH